jgi:hypothetical protein
MRLTVGRKPDNVERDRLTQLVAAELDEYKTHPDPAQMAISGAERATDRSRCR